MAPPSALDHCSRALDDDAVGALRRAEEAMPVELVEVRPGRRLAVHQRRRPGCEDTVFLVHGSCASMLQWPEQLEMFAEAHNVVAFDAFGCGRSPKPDGWSHYASDELYEDLSALFSRFRGSGRNIVVAHSMGCSFALRLAASSPEGAVRALALLSATAVKPAVAAGPLFRLPVGLLRLLQPTLDASFIRMAFHPTTVQSTEPGRRELIALASATSGSNPMFMCKAYYRQLAVPSHEELAQVRVPVLLLHGADDGVIQSSDSLKLQSLLKHASVSRQEVPSCSHQLMQENAAPVNGLIAAFLHGEG